MTMHEQRQIIDIRAFDLPELVDQLPYASSYQENFAKEGESWRFTFDCWFDAGRFQASTLGRTPRIAFLLGRNLITQQLIQWRKIRFNDSLHDGSFVNLEPERPRILIVDDDVDLALALQTAFSNMNCQAEIATGHEDLHRKIIAGHADIILLDWKLNDQITADSVVTRTSRLIDTFSDLRAKFADKRPQIVTHSVLDRSDVMLPCEGRKYFSHYDHWQKPLPFHEIVERTSNLMNAWKGA